MLLKHKFTPPKNEIMFVTYEKYFYISLILIHFSPIFLIFWRKRPIFLEYLISCSLKLVFDKKF